MSRRIRIAVAVLMLGNAGVGEAGPPPAPAATALPCPGHHAPKPPPPGLAPRDVEVRGGSVTLKGWHFLATGTPRWVTVVYLHGAGADRTSGSWAAVRLVPRGFDVLALDGPPAGDAGGEAGRRGPLGRPELLRALDQLGVQRAILLDGSAGAAVRREAEPEDRRVLGVVAVEDGGASRGPSSGAGPAAGTPETFRILLGGARSLASSVAWPDVERWLDEVAPPKGPPAEPKVPGIWAFAGIVPGEPQAPELLERFPASALDPTLAVEALNRRWPEPGVVLVRQKEEAVFLRVRDAELLTQGMGTTGALDYMATVVVTLTSLPGVELVHLDFPEGDHAAPGLFERGDFAR